jgi:23S rRNA (pseudouridine1915-N3)-methyltransferase
LFSKIVFIHLGKFKSSQYAELFEDYYSRIKRYVKVEVKEIKIAVDEKTQFEKIMPKINDAIKGSKLVALSERGKNVTSEDFAKFIDSGSGSLCVLTGTSWGMSETLEKNANFLLSFGKLTLPHEAVRFLVAEQLYRSLTIIRGESYHK